MSASTATVWRFSKMQGAGNDFLIFDRRDGRDWPDGEVLQRWADRRFGVGCDQIISIEAADHDEFGYDIRNADGGRAAQCGNGARCVAAWLWRDGAVTGDSFRLHSPAGSVPVLRLEDGQFQVTLAIPDFDPPAAGLNDPEEPLRIELDGWFWDYQICSLGNPHALFEVDNLDAVDVVGIGRALQNSGRFADGVNVGFAQVIDSQHIRLQVFERGTGLTLACGSGACAAAAMLIRAGRVRSPLRIDMPGGELQVSWAGEGKPVALSGPATFVFEGEVSE